MFINEARLAIEKGGKQTEVKRENVDRLTGLCSLRGPHAQIGVIVGTSIDHGEVKIDVSVTLTCDQNEVAMDEAARIALEIGHEYMNLGLRAHEVPPIAFNAASLWDTKTEPTTPDRLKSISSGRGPVAHVGVGVGTSLGYGEIKVKSNVRLECDQTEVCLGEGGALAIEKSNQYTRWGLSGYRMR